MDNRLVQLMAILGQISVRGDDVERMCKARMLIREVAVSTQSPAPATQPTEKKGES